MRWTLSRSFSLTTVCLAGLQLPGTGQAPAKTVATPVRVTFVKECLEREKDCFLRVPAGISQALREAGFIEGDRPKQVLITIHARRYFGDWAIVSTTDPLRRTAVPATEIRTTIELPSEPTGIASAPLVRVHNFPRDDIYDESEHINKFVPSLLSDLAIAGLNRDKAIRRWIEQYNAHGPGCPVPHRYYPDLTDFLDLGEASVPTLASIAATRDGTAEWRRNCALVVLGYLAGIGMPSAVAEVRRIEAKVRHLPVPGRWATGIRATDHWACSSLEHLRQGLKEILSGNLDNPLYARRSPDAESLLNDLARPAQQCEW